MHIGHYHGALKNWVRLQEEYECLFFAADWHALTTHYETPEIDRRERLGHVHRLARGRASIPTRATIFIQSRVPEHAELTLLLGMITPVGWLERVPTYKDQQQKLADHDLSNYGFLGYPVMQGADILIYRANMVPVGEDQVSHIELTRELARRFNHIYGREPGFEEKAKAAVKKLGAKKAQRYDAAAHRVPGEGRRRRRSRPRATLLERHAEPVARRSRAPVRLPRRLAPRDPARAAAAADRDAEGAGPRRPEDVEVVRQRDPAARGSGRRSREKIRTMQTDPARVRRTDPGQSGELPGVAAAQDLLRRGHAGLGGARAARPRASAASNASSR